VTVAEKTEDAAGRVVAHFLKSTQDIGFLAWDRYSRSFKQERIPLDNYNPFHHGFFSYKSWRNTQVDAKRSIGTGKRPNQ
jgi:hypothetical protein